MFEIQKLTCKKESWNSIEDETMLSPQEEENGEIRPREELNGQWTKSPLSPVEPKQKRIEKEAFGKDAFGGNDLITVTANRPKLKSDVVVAPSGTHTLEDLLEAGPRVARLNNLQVNNGNVPRQLFSLLLLNLSGRLK